MVGLPVKPSCETCGNTAHTWPRPPTSSCRYGTRADDDSLRRMHKKYHRWVQELSQKIIRCKLLNTDIISFGIRQTKIKKKSKKICKNRNYQKIVGKVSNKSEFCQNNQIKPRPPPKFKIPKNSPNS